MSEPKKLADILPEVMRDIARRMDEYGENQKHKIEQLRTTFDDRVASRLKTALIIEVVDKDRRKPYKEVK